MLGEGWKLAIADFEVCEGRGRGSDNQALNTNRELHSSPAPTYLPTHQPVAFPPSRTHANSKHLNFEYFMHPRPQTFQPLSDVPVYQI